MLTWFGEAKIKNFLYQAFMKLPDGSRTPLFLQLIQWITSPLEYLEPSAQRYGDTFTAQWGKFPPFVLLSNPQAIQELFTFQPRYVSVGAAFLSRVSWVRINRCDYLFVHSLPDSPAL